MQPHVGVILVNYNGYEDTTACINSLLQLNYSSKTIYVVDNQSPDGSGERLHSWIKNKQSKELKFIQSKDNLGFSGGNNLAMKEALKDGVQYVWLINNDTEVDSNALLKMVSALTEDNKIGMAGSKIYYYNSDLLWYAGGYFNSLGLPRHRGLDEQDAKNTLYNELSETDFITGCSLLVKAELIQQIGMLDDDFFMYYEDAEWSLRAKKNGWKLVYVPESIVWHKVGSSTGREKKDHSPIIEYYDIRNNIFFIKKVYSNAEKIIPTFTIVLKLVKKHVRLVISQETRKKEKLAMIYQGLYDAMVGNKGLLKKK
ncbi:glycosyltransferase family 2 protein [Bacillus taeanensis]|uniref:glycosyltransferase family 2 protein n=1 Tax=Bacillus taeanensis TaxID=273032 RepID=UPI0015F0862B|nr:glycosyltransferase family 2 protein [Bacillus taeanensis]